MEEEEEMKEVKWFKYLLAVVTAAALAGCGNKPPECADAAATNTLRSLLDEQAKTAAGLSGPNSLTADQEVIQSFLTSWTFSVANIATTGYHETSRTRTCQGKATLALPGQNPRHVDFEYELQKFEDSKGDEFQLRAGGSFVALAKSAGYLLHQHHNVASVRGTWEGTPKCQPARVLSKAQGAFPEEESVNGFEILSTERAWIPDGPGTAPMVSATAEGGTVTMTISQGSEPPLKRLGSVTESRALMFKEVDGAVTVVSNFFEQVGGAYVPSQTDLGTKARLKSIATGREHEALLLRTCELKLVKK